MDFCGTIQNIVFHNEQNGWTVMEVVPENEKAGKVQKAVYAVGTMPLCCAGERVALEGEWVDHREYGKQFKFSSYTSFLPSTLFGIEKFLSSGLIKGVGPATAKNIIRMFGEETFTVLESDWEKLAKIRGISLIRAQEIAMSYAQQVGLRTIMLALQDYGITTHQAITFYKIYGNNSINIIKQNPYKIIDDIPGIGFKTADAIAQKMGFEKDSDYRISSGIKFTLNCEKNDSGHTCVPREFLIEASCERLDCQSEKVESILQNLIIEGEVVSKQIKEKTMIFLPYLYFFESTCAKYICELNFKPNNIFTNVLEKELESLEQQEKIDLDEMQKTAVLTAFKSGALVITGGPGTGKTTIINFILTLMDKLGLDYEICAPTGRAAKRLCETTGKEARTIHRLLEYNGDKFLINEQNQLETDAVIVDESSMVDVALLHSLMSALSPGTRIIFAGDADQLPSVGAGNVLSDLITSLVIPVVKLTQIFRQAEKSNIIVNAHKINQGQMPILDFADDFAFSEKTSPESVLKTLIGAVTRRNLGDPWVDLQVLSPTKKGILGVKNLNAELQQALNPKTSAKNEKVVGETTFRVCDKVMQIKNNYNLQWEKPGQNGIETGSGVFNGDIGTIMSIYPHDKIVQILFDDERTAFYDFELLLELDLAYCISVHKSQGSEFPKIIIPIFSGPPMLMTRNLLYTAITRARTYVFIVGRTTAIKNMVDNIQERERYSALDSFLIQTATLYNSLYKEV